MTNTVYIARSLDGFIADSNGGLEWLHQVPNQEGGDYGFSEFIARIDGILMGRKTYESVIDFDVPWPYEKPVFVLSSTLTEVPGEFTDKVCIVNGAPDEVITSLNQRGFQNLYIDGGLTIQSLLSKDLIDELILTDVPVLLGGGVPLFGALVQPLWFDHADTRVLGKQLVQRTYLRKRGP